MMHHHARSRCMIACEFLRQEPLPREPPRACAHVHTALEYGGQTLTHGPLGWQRRACDKKPKVGKRPAPSRHRSPTLSQAVRGSRSLPPPFLDGRESVASTTRANICASIGVTGNQRPATSLPRRAIHRSPRLTDCARYRTESACRDRPEHPSTLMSAADFASSLTDQWKHAETGGADQPRGACGTKARTRTGASGDARGCGQSRRLPI
jgi:hypothetical protein